MTNNVPLSTFPTESTKIVVVIREDLQVWQKLNVTAFLSSGIAATTDEAIGLPYEDADGVGYHPMFGQPVLIFAATADELRRSYERVARRGLRSSIYTEALFGTGNDIDNRAAVSAVPSDDLALVGLAFRAPKNAADKVTKGLRLHG